MGDKLLTIREVSRIINLSEKEIIELTKSRQIPYFKIAGEFLRFKKDDIIKIEKEIQKQHDTHKEKGSLSEKMDDFFHFNDFYIVATLVIVVLMWVIFKV